jgi:hypothetical protein
MQGTPKVIEHEDDPLWCYQGIISYHLHADTTLIGFSRSLGGTCGLAMASSGSLGWSLR